MLRVPPAAFVDSFAGRAVQTREQVTEIVTLTTEEYVVETETIVGESCVIPVEHEVTVRDHNSIATAQSAPAVSVGASPIVRARPLMLGSREW